MDIVDTARPASAASTATEALLVPSPARRRRRRTQGKWWIPWVFLAPALLLFLVFRYIPMVQAVSMSVENVRPYLGNEFVGLANYQTILSSTDFRDATINTLVLALGQTAGSLGVGFLLALLLEGQTRKLSFLRSAAFLPVVVPMAVIAELWRIMYYPAADGFDDAGEFMAERHRRRAGKLAMEQVPVGAAHAAGLDPDQKLVRASDGPGNLAERYRADGLETDCFHGRRHGRSVEARWLRQIRGRGRRRFGWRVTETRRLRLVGGGSRRPGAIGWSGIAASRRVER